jgi:signal peptidase
MNGARQLWEELRRPLTAVGCVFVSFMLAVTAFSAISGVWPPYMAVESKSMQHSEDTSRVGVIDTGDVVVARHPSGLEDIKTYVGSIVDGYQSYGEYGDVIVYQSPGEGTPIVHRAICELVYDGCGGFDIPELSNVPADLWDAPGAGGRWWGLQDSLDLFQVGYSKATVHIDLAGLLAEMGASPHGGLITMGDNNWYDQGGERRGVIDQGNLVDGPILWEWVVGKVTGEIPWVGSLRLWLTGTAPDYLPHNSIAMLGAVIASLIALPTALYAAAAILERRAERRERGRRGR